MDQSLSFNRALVEKYDRPGPRYTSSYPTAPQFHQAFAMDDYHGAAQASNQAAAPKALSLYIHIPFCKSLCYYCACNKIITQKTHRAVEYLNYLKREIAMQAALFDRTRTLRQLHLGGGTSTYLTREQLAELMDCLHQAFNLDDSDEHEFSIEVDPRTISTEQIEHLRQLGFNRLSFGVQDFDPDVQAAVNRQQSEEQIYALVAAAREAKFKSVSVDLIYGVPGVARETFQADVEAALALDPEHLSCYCLEIEDGTPFARAAAAGELEVSEDEQRAQFDWARGRLAAAGLAHYEISNFAKPGRECRQNLLYWCGGDYLGVGPAAHSHWAGARWGNSPELPEWRRAFEEKLEPAAKARETLVMGLRRIAGWGRAEFRAATGFDYDALRGPEIARLAAEELLVVEPDRLRLAEDALFVSDAVFAELV